jgi:hypothetical protein
MTTKINNEMTEVQPTTAELIAAQEQAIAERDALISQRQQAEAAAAMQAQAAIAQQEQERAHILECWGAMNGAASMWNEVRALAGKHADEPRLILGLLCLSVVDGNNFKDHWRAYVEAWQLGMDPSAPDVLSVAKYAELDAAHNEREANKERERQANRARR